MLLPRPRDTPRSSVPRRKVAAGTARDSSQGICAPSGDSSTQSVQRSRRSLASRGTLEIHNLSRSLSGTAGNRAHIRGTQHRARMIRAGGNFVFCACLAISPKHGISSRHTPSAATATRGQRRSSRGLRYALQRKEVIVRDDRSKGASAASVAFGVPA